MNTPVSFELAKLLKEKGFNKYGYLQEVWLGNKYEWRGKGKNKKSVEVPVFGLGSSSVLPTITDVVMWLYKKHGIWIKNDVISINRVIKFYSSYYKINDGLTQLPIQLDGNFNSPTEAYEAAIEYTLNNLI